LRSHNRFTAGGIAALFSGFLIFVPTAPAIARELGVDVSHHQGSTGIPQSNWNALKADGKQFAYIKATEGLLPPGNVDFAQPNNTARATAAGILNGVYHFARPDNRPNVQGAIDEATHFVATAGNAMNPGHLRPVIDLERGNALSTTLLTDWVLAFVNRVVELKGPAAEPIVYTSSNWAAFELDNRVSTLDAWIVSLNGQDPHTGAPSSSGHFGNWAIWQYSFTGSSGGISPIDLDVFNNDRLGSLSAIVIPEPTAGLALIAAIGFLRRRRSVRRCS
jgi:GH25 family lysozyme M1 (1,4-beta-N-acetylmuramidase)